MSKLEDARKRAAALAGKQPDTPATAPPVATQTVMTVEGKELPPAYAEMGVTRGFAPPNPESIFMLLQSYSGGGKTTFVSSIPGGLVVSFQADGASSVIAPKAHRITVTSYAAWRKLADRLIADASGGKRPFTVIAIDTADEWFDVLSELVIKKWNEAYRSGKDPITSIGEVGSDGKGYGDVAEEMSKEVEALLAAGYGVICTLHLQEKTITIGREKITVVRTLLANSSYKSLIPKAYLKGFLANIPQTTEVRTITVKGTQTQVVVNIPPEEQRFQYRLALQSNETDDEIKIRLAHLPPYVVIGRHDGWLAFRAAFMDAVAKADAEDKELTNPKTSHVETKP